MNSHALVERVQAKLIKQHLQLAGESRKNKPAALKKFEVFRSVVRVKPDIQTGLDYWFEEFRVIGEVEHFTAEQALQTAKRKYPEAADRIAVALAATPETAMSLQKFPVSKEEAGRQMNILINKAMGKVS